MIAIVVLTALIATIVGSISGIGGGVIIKPVMDAICPLTPSQISFLSGTTVLTMTIVSLLRSRKDTIKVDRRGIFMAIGGAFGGILGKWVFDKTVSSFEGSAVALIQNIIMVALTVAVLIYTINKQRIRTKNYNNDIFSVAVGLFLGVVSSFLGIGGGPINIMILSYLFSMDSKLSALTSLYVIFFSQTVSFISAIAKGSHNDVDFVMLISMMVAAVIGATIGRKVSKKLSNSGVDKLFICILVVIIGISIYNVIRFI